MTKVGKLGKSNQNVVMDEELVQKIVMDEELVQDVVMDEKIVTNPVMSAKLDVKGMYPAPHIHEHLATANCVHLHA